MRNPSISICKAIGIILMVMGHAGFHRYIFNFIHMFHMPLFFIISGFLFSTKYGGVELFIRRIKSLYFPFVKYNLIFLCLHNLFLILGLYSEIIPSSEVSYYSVSDFLSNAAYIIFLMLRAEPILGQLWFLRELFIATFVIFLTLKMFRKINWQYLQLIFLVLLLIFSFYVQFPIQRAIITPSAILASIFFYTGYKLKNYKLQDNLYINSVYFIIVLTGSIICPVNMQSFSLSNVVLFYFCALFGFLLSYNVSKKLATIKKLKTLLIYIGDNTLTVLIWHLLAFKLVHFIRIYCNELPYREIGHLTTIPNPEWWSIMYTLIGVLAPISILYVSKRIPFFNR